MSILLRKERGFYAFTGIAKLAIIDFIMALASALVTTIWAVYMFEFINSDSGVGFLSAILTFVGFCSYFFIVPIIEKKSKSKIFAWSLFSFGVMYALFALTSSLYSFLVLAFVMAVLGTLRGTSFGIMIRDKSAKRKLSRNEGLIYTFANVAFVFGPLIAGFISSRLGINHVFALSSVFIFTTFFLFRFSGIKDTNIRKRAHKDVFRNFFVFFKKRERVFSYILRGGVSLWWVLIYLFMPLFIIENNLGRMWVGYFLFAISVPLILFQYKFAKLAGKIGFKKLFKIGFLIPCILAFICFFTGNIFVTLGLLVLASIGLAMLEANTEAYFFDILKPKEELRFYGPYNTTMNMNNLLGKLAGASLLLVLPFKFIFLLFSFFMLMMFILSFRIKEIVEEKRRND